MAGTDLEARMRITAETAQAVKAARDLRDEVKQVKTAADSGPDPLAKTAAAMRRSADAAEKANERTAKSAERAAERKAKADELAADRQAKASERATRRSADEAAKALRRTQHQLSLIGPQITDIVTSVAGGQSVFQVAIQQGGQLRDVYGGFGPAFRALGSVLTGFRVLVGGAAAAAGTLVFNIAQGALESDRLNKILAVTGNVANTSLGQLDAQAKQIAATQNVAIGSVRETLEAVVASGAYVGETVRSAASAVTALSRITGQTNDEVLKQLSVLEGGVAEGAAKLNKAYNFLTAEQFRQIRALEAQGRTQEAMRLTLDELTGTINQRAAPAIGSLERGWIAVKNAVSGALDAMKAIGRETTPEQRIKELTERLRELQRIEEQRAAGRNNSGIRAPRLAADIAAVRAELDQATRQRNSDLLRQTERSIDQQGAQALIDLERKSQDSLAQVAQAGLQKRLAQELAGLDARRSATERANAQGLLTQRQYTQALLAIEAQRLAAQVKALDQARAAVEAKRPGSPDEARAQSAELLRIETQRIAAVSALQSKRVEASTAADAAALDQARTAAQDWAAIWQRANDRLRQFAAETAATQARLLNDPAARAAADAEAAVADLRRDLIELARDLSLRISLTVDPAARAELERQLQQLQAQGKAVVDERLRSGTFDSFARQVAERQAQLAAKEEQINAEIAAGQKTVADGEREILGLRADQVRLLDEILKRMAALANTPEEKAVVDQLRAQITSLADVRTEIDRTARSAGVNSIKGLLDDVTTGANEGKEALLDMVGSYAKAMLNVLNQRLAEQLVDQFTKAAASSGGSGGGFLSSIGSWIVSLFHGGGVVGQGSPRTRAVNPLMFALAPRFHDGLLPGEFPSILKVGETVRTERQEADLQRRLGTAGGGVSVSVKVEGANGSEADMRQGGTGLGNEIATGVMDICNAWALREMRPGGLLSPR